MARKTMVYFDEGDFYWGTEELSQSDREDLYETAKADGHVGYLSGQCSHPVDKKIYPTIIFFHSPPGGDEIQKHKENGLKGARWYSIEEED